MHREVLLRVTQQSNRLQQSIPRGSRSNRGQKGVAETPRGRGCARFAKRGGDVTGGWGEGIATFSTRPLCARVRGNSRDTLQGLR